MRCPVPAAAGQEEELQLPVAPASSRGVDALTAESLAAPITPSSRGVDALTAESLATPVTPITRGVDALVEALLNPSYAESEKHADSTKINTEIIVPESESDQDFLR